MFKRIVTISFFSLMVLLISSGGYAGPKYKWKLASSTNPKYVEGQFFEHFIQLVDEFSNGDIKITPYWNSSLGSGKEVYEQCQQGYLEIATGSYANISTLTTAFEVLQLPYIFESAEQSFNAHFSPTVRAKINEQLASKKLHWFMSVPLTPRQILSTNFKAQEMSDMRGKKFRTSRSQLEIAMVNAFGAKAVTIAWTEAIDSMRTGMIDGMTVPADMPYVANLHDTIKYVGMVNAMSVGHIGLVNTQWWTTLPYDAKAVVLKAAAETEKWYRPMLIDYINNGIKEGQKRGVTYYGYTDAQRQDFIEAGQSIWSEFEDICPPDVIKVIQDEMGPAGDPTWGLEF